MRQAAAATAPWHSALSHRWSYVYEKYLDEEPEQGTFQHHRWRLAHVLNLWPLQFFFMSLVVINGIMIGIAADCECFTLIPIPI